MSSFFLSVPSVTSVSVRSDPNSPVSVGSAVLVTCTVVLSSAVMEYELLLITIHAWLTRAGNTMLALGEPTISGMTLTYTFSLDSFTGSDSGNYTCTATIRPASAYLTAAVTGVLSNTTAIIAGTAIKHRVHNPQRVTKPKSIA